MSTKQKTTTALDPKFDAAVYGNLDSAKALQSDYQPYTGQTYAGFNPVQQQAQQSLINFGLWGDTGQDSLNQAKQAAGGVLGYQPQQVGAQQINAPGAVNAQQVNPAQIAGTDLSPYMNPYQSSVIDSTMSQYDRQNQIDLNNARGRAASAGAFGGSGSALLQAQTQEANSRNLGSTLAGLNQANFSQAQGAAGADVASRNQAAYANQGANLNAQQFNAGGVLDAARANQSANLTAQQSNQQAGILGNDQQMRLSGILSGLSDQERAQALQSLGIVASVGDTQQAGSQATLDAQHQAYLDELQQRLALQQGANSATGIIPQTGTTTGKTSGLGTVVNGIAGLAKAAGTVMTGMPAG